MSSNKISTTPQQALDFHKYPTPGKIAIAPTKPLLTAFDLSLAYSPGVAHPCIEINQNPETSYDYTSRSNFVAVISNGTAVLGLGNLGAAASKPVMEGKAVLFKRFADIDSIDVEIDSENIDEIIQTVNLIGESWGGINLEDIKSPDCFIIESKLKEMMDIPVFHDDQHGTAVISLAGLINACEITGRKISDLKIVLNGAGAAGIACIELMKLYGVKHENVIMCDKTGVIYEGRNDSSMNQWKSAHAVPTKARTLEEALVGADVFLGLSAKDAVSQDMIKNMAPKPIIFAMANPDPEITPEKVHEVRPDAIVATGRSDYPNQVNNVMGFPYIFRGALDVRARKINDEMKLAAAEAIASLAREHVPDEVIKAYPGRKLEYGAGYIIPTPFDPRLIVKVSSAVAKAAIETGVARKPITDWKAYERSLQARLDPASNIMNTVFEKVSEHPKTIAFADGEEPEAIKAATMWRDGGYGTAVLIGREAKIKAACAEHAIKNIDNIKIMNAAMTQDRNDKYIDIIYKKLQRKGYLHRDCERMVKSDRNIFASCLLEAGEIDGLVLGVTRNYRTSLNDAMHSVDKQEGKRVFGLSALINKNKIIFIADTAVHDEPTAEQLAAICEQAAEVVKRFGITPRVALTSFSNFGSAITNSSKKIHEAVTILENKKVDFEFEGEMNPSVAIDKSQHHLYPFIRLTDSANILVMPDLNSANITAHLLQEVDAGTVIGPILTGFKQPVQIARVNSSASELFNCAALAGFLATGRGKK